MLVPADAVRGAITSSARRISVADVGNKSFEFDTAGSVRSRASHESGRSRGSIRCRAPAMMCSVKFGAKQTARLPRKNSSASRFGRCANDPMKSSRRARDHQRWLKPAGVDAIREAGRVLRAPRPFARSFADIVTTQSTALQTERLEASPFLELLFQFPVGGAGFRVRGKQLLLQIERDVVLDQNGLCRAAGSRVLRHLCEFELHHIRTPAPDSLLEAGAEGFGIEFLDRIRTGACRGGSGCRAGAPG